MLSLHPPRLVKGLLCTVGFLVLTAPARAQALDQKKIDQAIDKGVAHLKKMQLPDGHWGTTSATDGRNPGATALVALALLHSGVPAKDASVAAAAAYLRPRVPDMKHTYSISLTILLLDRLGEAADVPLIKTLGARLLAGQRAKGGWTYECPPRPPMSPAGTIAPTFGDPPDLKTGGLPNLHHHFGDNSNTQFAMMAVWAARRHGVPGSDKALTATRERFQLLQLPSGEWPYLPGLGVQPDTHGITAAGVLGLVLGEEAVLKAGLAKESLAKLKDDAKFQKGLAALRQTMDTVEKRFSAKKTKDGIIHFRSSGLNSYYYLFSLQRTADALGLETIEGKDWYHWGASILLANQAATGSWQGSFEYLCADTSFALLFLKRAKLLHGKQGVDVDQ